MYAQNIHVWGQEPSEVIKLVQQIPTPEPTPVVRESVNIQALVCSYDWDCAKALRIMFCESSNNPRNYASSNYGLFQINAVHVDMTPHNSLEELYDPEINIRIAYELYQARGWQPWVVCGS